MKLYKSLKTALVLVLVLTSTTSEVFAEKLPPNVDSWQYRTANFLNYYERSELIVDSEGRLAIGANSKPLGAVKDANGLPIPIHQVSSDTAGAGLPVELEVYFDAFSKEFQLQVSYASDRFGRLPNSLSFVVNDGMAPTGVDTNKWAMFYVDATNTQLDKDGFQLPNINNRPKLTVCKYRPEIGGPLQNSCTMTTPILSSQRASDEQYVAGSWPTGLEKFRRVEIADFTHGLLQVKVRQFTINIDATPILQAFGNVSGLGVGPQGSTVNLDDTTIFPPIGVLLASYANVSFGYNGVMIASVSNPSAQTLMQFFNTPVSSRCPIDCVGDIWGTGNNGAVCNPVAPPPPEDPGLCVERDFTDNLFELDGGAAGLNEIVKYTTRQIKRSSRGLSTSDKQIFRRAANKNLRAAEAAFIEAWKISWSFPQVIITCNDVLVPGCQSVDLTSLTNRYLFASMSVRDSAYDNIRQMKRLSRKISSSRKKRHLRKVAQKLSNEIGTRYAESVELSQEVPLATIVCSR
jgi:hypothetical protein